MKPITRIVTVAVLFCLVFSVSAESIDRFGIIEENTGSLATIREYDTPDLTPGQRVEVVVVVRGLQTRWGEGQVRWRHRIFDEMGQTVAQSRLTPYTHRSSGGEWDLLRVETVDLPRDLPDGRYRIDWEVIDDHADTTYRGNAAFTIGMSAAGENVTERPSPEPAPTPVQPPKAEESPTAVPSGEYVATIEGIEITLTDITRDSNRLTFRMRGINRGTEDYRLDIYSYTTRLIDGNGREYSFDDVGGSTNLSQGVTLPLDVPMQLDIEFRDGAVAVDSIALLEVAFYYTDDVIRWRDLTVPAP